MRSKPIRRVMWGVLGGLALWLAPHANAQCHYEVTVITGPPCFPDPNISIGLEGINDLGQACGWQAICSDAGGMLPLVWTPEQGIILLPLPEGATRGVANDINDVLGSDGFGQVACTLSGGTIGGNKPYLYDDGVWTPLGLLPGAAIGEALAINDKTEIVGTTSNPAGGPQQAFIWRDGVMSPVELPLGPNSLGFDISERSSIVGSMGDAKTTFALGFLQSNGETDQIPPLSGGISSEGRGVNVNDVVTGKTVMPIRNGSVPRRSWVYVNGRLTDLGGFADTHRNSAEDINDAGQIVGSCFALFGGATPYLWQDGDLIRLQDHFDLPSGIGGFANVKAINNRGQIVGRSGGASHGIILTPIALLGDINLDCQVNGEDLALVLGDWGPCAQTGSCLCDIVTSSTFQPPGDNIVDGADLAVVLGNWTDAGAASAATRQR